MINLEVDNPTELWLKLGYLVFATSKLVIDYEVSSRLISVHNRFVINNWDEKWTGMALFHTVGYERTVSNKMTRLINTYIDVDQWQAFLNQYLEVKDTRYFAIGMNFKMKPAGKGGCLSSFHIVKTNKQLTVIVTSKIAEVPKKFLADLRLISYMLDKLGIKKVKVVFNCSVIFYSLITLRSYKTILGEEIDTDLDLEKDFGGYQRPTIRRLTNYREHLKTIYGAKAIKKGLLNKLCLETGDWNG